MSWRPAACITEMLTEANTLAPHRSKASDGIIGDASHAASQSDHNPDSRGIVHAIDLTEDPAGGWDCGKRTEQIRLSKDRRVLYVIFDHRWYHGNRGGQWGHTPWAWEPYHGSSAHVEHMHVSVEYGETFENDVHPWFGPATPPPQPEEDDVDVQFVRAKGQGQGYLTDGVTSRSEVEPLPGQHDGWGALAQLFGLTVAQAKEKYPLRELDPKHFVFSLPVSKKTS